MTNYWYAINSVLSGCLLYLLLHKAKPKRQIPASPGQYLVELIRIAEKNHLKYTNITLDHVDIGWENPVFKLIFTYRTDHYNDMSFQKRRAQHGFEAGVMNWLSGLGYPAKFEYRVPYVGYRELVLFNPEPQK
jgi:hypothetical protein